MRMGVVPYGMSGESFAPQMGSTMGQCPTGYYKSPFGICVPNLGTVLDAAKTGATVAVATGAAQSPTVQKAAEDTLASRAGIAVKDFAKGNASTIAYVGVGAAALLVAYMLFGRK